VYGREQEKARLQWMGAGEPTHVVLFTGAVVLDMHISIAQQCLHTVRNLQMLYTQHLGRQWPADRISAIVSRRALTVLM
jgi:hypothetical protein